MGSSKKIVVWGGSGFLGQFLIERLILMGHTNILSVARGEGAQVALHERFPSVSIMIGDMADPWTVKKAMAGVSTCFILSAMKHVGLAEKDVKACIDTNIVGLMNVLEEARFMKSLNELVFISTDKAAQGTGVYGCSKKIGEKLIEEAQDMDPFTKYRVVRYGNVLYSTGSVLCKWRDRMKAGEEVIVTDKDATRFYWPVSEAVDLIFECMAKARDAKPYVTKMKSIRLGDLLDAMMSKYGEVPVRTIGLQPGENLHEIIIPEWPDSSKVDRYTKEEIFELI